MKLSIFTDEINPDPARAIRLAATWKVPCVEVRSLPGGRFPMVEEAELEEFGKRVADAGLAVSGVSPGFFKCDVGDPEVAEMMTEGLPRACEWARRWGTDLVSCFGFRRPEVSSLAADAPAVPAVVIDKLGEMADATASSGCRLVLENEAVCWGDTGLEAAEIVRRVGSDAFTLLWDPGNSARAGSTCPFPEEYAQLKDLVTHVHLKNFDPGTGQWSLMEKGVVDWPGQFAALAEEGYEGFAVVETHLRISPDEFEVIDDDLDALEGNSRRNLDYLRTLVDL